MNIAPNAQHRCVHFQYILHCLNTLYCHTRWGEGFFMDTDMLLSCKFPISSYLQPIYLSEVTVEIQKLLQAMYDIMCYFFMTCYKLIPQLYTLVHVSKFNQNTFITVFVLSYYHELALYIWKD